MNEEDNNNKTSTSIQTSDSNYQWNVNENIINDINNN
jgi:hypothetical protein